MIRVLRLIPQCPPSSSSPGSCMSWNKQATQQQWLVSKSCDAGEVFKLFLTGWDLKSLPIWKNFPTSKMADIIWVFLATFANCYPLLRVFLPQKWSFTIYSQISVKWDPLLRVLFDQNRDHVQGFLDTK